METSHVEVRGNYLIKIFQDEDAQNPREDRECCAKMICFHSRYKLGDKHSMSPEEAKAEYEKESTVGLPLYLYDHSGITINTSGFSCPWDSGQVGFIYVTKEKALKEWGRKRLTKALLTKITNSLKSEVKEYDDFLTGSVYGYTVEPDDDSKKAKQGDDSCWGFYGYYKDKGGCLEQAREIADQKTSEDVKYWAEHKKAEQETVLEAGCAV